MTIGRSATANLPLDDSLASKVQATLQFRNEWFVCDGDGGRASTNGSWLFLNEDVQVYTGLVFKVQSTVFRASLFRNW